MKDRSNLGDEKLMILVSKFDDREAFEILIDRYKKRILNYILRIVRDFSISEELTQDVFVSIYLNRKRYTSTGKFSSYIFKIATNMTFNYLKKGKEDVFEIKNVSDGDLDPLLRLIEDERKKIFEKNLDKLSPVERMAILLYVKEEKSYKEISEIMDCSLQSVKNYIHRGKLKLIEEIDNFLKKSMGDKKNV